MLDVFNHEVFLVAASLLILGFLFSWLSKHFKLPRVTGYILAGIVLGPSILSVFDEVALHQLDFIPQFALGIIALIIGADLSFSLLQRLGFRLILITLMQTLAAFILVFGCLVLLKMPLGAALPLAAIATATAPAATVAVIKEYRARGPLTEATLAVVALDDAIAIILFGLVLTLNVKHLGNFGHAAIQSFSTSFIEILIALIVGMLLGFLANVLIKVSQETSDALIIILGIVLLGIGISHTTHISPLLTNMFLGMTLINISAKHTERVTYLERFTPPIYCLFFVMAGAHLNIKAIMSFGSTLFIWGAVFVVARIIGKVAGAYFGAAVSNAPTVIKKYLGLALIPQAGVAIGLSLLISQASGFFEYRSIIINITLISVAFNEIIGPLSTKYALFKAKEATIEN
ncbi:cation:proton antiporter [Candidatus Margulisiibacteriota bacterium]